MSNQDSNAIGETRHQFTNNSFAFDPMMKSRMANQEMSRLANIMPTPIPGEIQEISQSEDIYDKAYQKVNKEMDYFGIRYNPKTGNIETKDGKTSSDSNTTRKGLSTYQNYADAYNAINKLDGKDLDQFKQNLITEAQKAGVYINPNDIAYGTPGGLLIAYGTTLGALTKAGGMSTAAANMAI